MRSAGRLKGAGIRLVLGSRVAREMEVPTLAPFDCKIHYLLLHIPETIEHG